MALLGKVLPLQIAGADGTGPITVEIVRFENHYESDDPHAKVVETDFKRLPPIN
jgi:hypothetical protein